MRRLLAGAGLSLALAVAAPREARACGGCFHDPGQVGTVVTDHRMIFRVTPTQTTLYDEIRYAGAPSSFAWVLPIHGPVTVGLSADVVFAALELATATTIEPPTLPSCPCVDQGVVIGDDGPTSNAGDSGVTVISQSVVGPYDTVQLASTNPTALADWLTTNGYALPADVQPVVAAYVKEGFDFLALKLAPGMGVQAMRPVSVTSPGAGLSLPLRMVAAGTGATVGVTLWVLGDGLYEPQNFPKFVVSPGELVWDWDVYSSNYTTVRAQKEVALHNAAWQMESSMSLPAYVLESPILAGPAANDYPVTSGGDAGDAGGGPTSDQARQADLAMLFPGGNQGNVQVTRMRADLSRAALATDLVLTAAHDPAVPTSNVYQVTQSIHATPCPVVEAGCDCSTFPGTCDDAGATPAGSGPGAKSGSGCVAAPSEARSGLVELLVAATAAIGLGRRRRRGLRPGR